MQTRTDQVTTRDGAFDVHLWFPERGTGPGVLIPHEIFGVSSYLRDVAAELAGRGYVVAVPDLFWRLQPGWAPEPGPDNLAASLALSARFDFAKGVTDCALALAHLRPLTTGKAGTLGFCLGGSLAFTLAATVAVDSVLAFYGSLVPDQLDLLEQIRCPVFLAFGGSDPYIPRERVRMAEKAAEGRPGVTVYVDEEAGHAFHNHQDPAFHQPEAAARVWPVALDFLRASLT
ncbi:dienelactone hydrolase family protein [Nonomuraea sp. NPDC050310]|uniref:dienelactone hydrolase family protein n=1 Tax=unclassified Nonomuraea TaxID=2593643 RepID=UPI0033F6FF87